MGYEVSIVINNYNYAQFVGEAIQSALEQTHSNTEVIVVDDGSTDASRAVIESFGSRIKALFKPNGGQGSAINAGFAMSSGEIVFFLDADDLLFKDAAQRVVEAWQPGLSKVQAPLEVMDAKGQATGELFPARPLSEGDLLKQVLRFGGYTSPPTSGNAWSREFLLRALPLDEAIWKTALDTALSCIAPLFGPVKTLHKPFGYYRLHGSNDWVRNSVDLTRMQRGRLFDLHTDRLLNEWLERLGYTQRPRIPLVKRTRSRITSLRLQPLSHPFSQDRLPQLVSLGLKGAWSEPGLSVAKRFQYTGFFILMAILPQPLAKRVAQWASGA